MYKTLHMIASQGINRFWILKFIIIVVAFLYPYWTVLIQLVSDWLEDPDYSHGFLIPFLSAYFVWRRSDELYCLKPQSSKWGLSFLIMGLSLLFSGHLGAEFFLMRFSMIIVICGLVVYLLGWSYLKILSFPIGYLMFMIPFPSILLNTLTFPLQLLAAKMSTACLQFADIPVYREGNLIILPQITLEVTEACSGIRSFMALTALAVVFAYLTQQSIWKRLVLILSAIPIAIAANAFRIWGTGFLAHLYGIELAEGFYHTFAGWLVFVVAFSFLLVEGYLLSRIQFPRRQR